MFIDAHTVRNYMRTANDDFPFRLGVRRLGPMAVRTVQCLQPPQSPKLSAASHQERLEVKK